MNSKKEETIVVPLENNACKAIENCALFFSHLEISVWPSGSTLHVAFLCVCGKCLKTLAFVWHLIIFERHNAN